MIELYSKVDGQPNKFTFDTMIDVRTGKIGGHITRTPFIDIEKIKPVLVIVRDCDNVTAATLEWLYPIRKGDGTFVATKFIACTFSANVSFPTDVLFEGCHFHREKRGSVSGGSFANCWFHKTYLQVNGGETYTDCWFDKDTSIHMDDDMLFTRCTINAGVEVGSVLQRSLSLDSCAGDMYFKQGDFRLQIMTTGSSAPNILIREWAMRRDSKSPQINCYAGTPTVLRTDTSRKGTHLALRGWSGTYEVQNKTTNRLLFLVDGEETSITTMSGVQYLIASAKADGSQLGYSYLPPSHKIVVNGSRMSPALAYKLTQFEQLDAKHAHENLLPVLETGDAKTMDRFIRLLNLSGQYPIEV